MSNQDDINNEINKAWAEFTEDSEKAKEAILGTFNEDTHKEEDERMGSMFVMIFPIGALVVIVVAIIIYICLSAFKNKKND